MKSIEGGMGNGSGHLGRSRDLAKSEKWLDKYFPTAPLILPSSADDLKWIFDLEKRTTMTKPWSIAYILKASLVTPTIPQKNLTFPQICPKMQQNGPKMTQNDPKWPKVAQIWPKWPKMALEWPKKIQSGPKMTQNDPKWPKMTQNDQKWPKMTQNG